MTNNPICKNCNHSITTKSYKFCPYCGQNTHIERIDFGTVIEELLDAFHIETNRLLNTIRRMLISPGTTLVDYLNGGRRKYQSPISFFFLSILFYALFVHYIAEPQKWYIGVVLNLSKYQLILLMVGLSFIGWLISGFPRFNFFETFVIFAFVYGTAFFMTPVFILAQAPFIHQIDSLPKVLKFVISDLPSSLLILYFIGGFFNVAKIGWYKFILTGIVGYLYYIFFIVRLA